MIVTVTANPAVDKVYFIEDYRIGQVHRPTCATVSAGGKGLNVSRVAQVLGEPTLAMGFVGGTAGRYIRGEMERLGIPSDFTEVAEETRTNTNISDDLGRSTELLEAGPTVTEAERAAFLAQYKKQLSRADIVCLSGSLPRGLDGSFYEELIALAKAQDKRVIVDTVVPLTRGVPFMIKPNADELGRGDPKEALAAMQRRGIALPLTTMGKDGALALIDGQYLRFIPPSVTVKNAVGSGDSTVAGIAVGLCRGLGLADAVRLGMAAGVANTQFEQTGVVTRELTERFYEQIVCESAGFLG